MLITVINIIAIIMPAKGASGESAGIANTLDIIPCMMFGTEAMDFIADHPYVNTAHGLFASGIGLTEPESVLL